MYSFANRLCLPALCAWRIPEEHIVCICLKRILVPKDTLMSRAVLEIVRNSTSSICSPNDCAGVRFFCQAVSAGHKI